MLWQPNDLFFFFLFLFYSILSLHVLFLVLFFFFCSSHYHSFSCLRILFTSWSVTGYIYSRLLLLRHFLQLLLILMSCAFLPNIHYTIISAFLTDLLHYLVFHSLIMQMLIECEFFFFFLFNCNCYSSVLLVLNFMWRKYSLNIDIWSSFVWFNNTKLHWSSKQNNKPKK